MACLPVGRYSPHGFPHRLDHLPVADGMLALRRLGGVLGRFVNDGGP